MYRAYDEQSLGFSTLFANDLATKEYLDTFPNVVRQKASPHKFNLNSVKQTKNNTEESVKKF
jgi:hypothetical protein